MLAEARPRSARPKSAKYLPAIVCALVLPLCALLVHPGVETGMMDEWSYIFTTRVFAQTGHVAYNGWGDPILGWQLLWGALFFKLFGFSFLVARLSVLAVAVPTIFFTQRCMVRCGINEWNATLGTLTFALTPIMLPISLGFMTDVPGMLAIMVCLYSCLRALQADTDRARMGWLCFAALGNTIGGTARQIGWLGVLVMVPCTIWLLRRRRRVVLVGTLSCVAGDAIVFATMKWYSHQPYSVAESLHRAAINRGLIELLPANILRPTLEGALFILPMLLMFLPSLWRSRKRALESLAGAAALGLLAYLMVHYHRAGPGLLAPFLMLHGNYVTTYGLALLWPMRCHYPVLLHTPVRVALSVATIASLMAVVATILRPKRARAADSTKSARLSWRQMLVLLVPFIAAYAVLLLPLGIVGYTLGKYLLPLLPVFLILLLRLYQDRMRQRLPWIALVLILLMGVYTVGITHDFFATYRAALAAANEMRAAGVPRTQIDNGWEYDAWTELEQGGYLHRSGVRLPGNAPPSYGKTKNVCPVIYSFLMPEVKTQYALSFNPNACEGAAGFAPVTYRRWFGPRTLTVYIVKNPLTTKDIDFGPAMRGAAMDLNCFWGCDSTKPMPPQ